jgi:hypothetical protein
MSPTLRHAATSRAGEEHVLPRQNASQARRVRLLHPGPDSWYITSMLGAYVGTASRFGLESFLPEDEGSIAAALSRSRPRDGMHPLQASFFALVSDEAADKVRFLLWAGNRAQAAAVLEAHAREISPLCPPPELCYLPQLDAATNHRRNRRSPLS